MTTATEVTCATEVFIATALLHREQPGRSDFTIQEIASRAARENITGEFRSGINVHASQHCVANRTPNPGRHRMLFATGKHTRRLLKKGDDVDPGRTGKIFPDRGEVPQRYSALLDWAKDRYERDNPIDAMPKRGSGTLSSGPLRLRPLNPGTHPAERWLESLFELEGLGKEHWKNVDPDEFVRELREGWE